KIFVLPNCIDFQKFSNSGFRASLLNKKEIIIGTVSRLERQKGIKYLIIAMSTILAKYPNARLEIIGDGSLLNELKSLSINLNISNSVFFFGKFVDVKPFYNRMDVFVLSSIYEGFGIVLLEAMASGVPVIASNVDGIKEVVTNMKSGILVPPKNPEAIANAVVKIIENPLLSKNLIDEGYKRAKLFDVQEHITKLDNLYTNLLGIESYK
ncbi:MAG: glycosyltransferase family 4 protein, partial [Ignavibacteriaceae bacterium]